MSNIYLKVTIDEKCRNVLKTSIFYVEPFKPTPQNGQTHSNNSSALAEEIV